MWRENISKTDVFKNDGVVIIMWFPWASFPQIQIQNDQWSYGLAWPVSKSWWFYMYLSEILEEENKKLKSHVHHLAEVRSKLCNTPSAMECAKKIHIPQTHFTFLCENNSGHNVSFCPVRQSTHSILKHSWHLPKTNTSSSFRLSTECFHIVFVY